MSFTKKFLTVFFLLAVTSCVYKEAQKTPEQRAAENAALDASFEREEKIMKCERQIKRNMKNPDSYERVEAAVGDNGKVVVRYRGTNSFNAVVVDEATCTVSN